MRIEVNGRPATAEALAHPALVNYGHFTAMQVRGGRVRGLDAHLRRLDAATRELFGTGLDADRVRDLIRHATGDEDASVRVNVHRPDAEPVIQVAVRPPVEAPSSPQGLLPVVYERPVPHIKHVGGFGQIHFGLQAQRAGFDDALLVLRDGRVAEGGITNIGFFRDGGVVWPDAPMLRGITMHLIDERLRPGREEIRPDDLPTFDGAFVTNSLGVAPVTRIGDVTYQVSDLMASVDKAYASVPWDRI
ncbi:aminotransferase class IV family protein [Actinomadura madurae]|uniref:aminotransferase class IV family protein n=1 Tax=Actinomadura madurae TaxID=1993 RepID=UPI0020D20AEB|nr:aminotransferase class IV family protein [Actinomadura madurae]MCP9979993.1 aminotransferase class IV family protein [Actinomadura madurae]MCQ0016209.1 aminotransferase class IV family protein [Actinomadura madurae]